MILPSWVEQLLLTLPAEFNGKVEIKYYRGGVTGVGVMHHHAPPKLWSGGPTVSPPERA